VFFATISAFWGLHNEDSYLMVMVNPRKSRVWGVNIIGINLILLYRCFYYDAYARWCNTQC